MRKVVTYIRVSTEEQARHGYSLEGQSQLLHDFAVGHDLDIVEEFVESQSAYVHGRPVFKNMIVFLKRRSDVDGVLVYKIDRLSRNMRDLAELTEIAKKRLISATEALPDGATGELMASIQASFARFESAKTSERVSMGLEAKARKGLWPTYAPTGYNNVDKGISPDPISAPLIRELYEKYVRSSMSCKGLAKWARNRGLRSRYGKALATSAVHKILTNPLYYGMIPWKGVLYEGLHEPIVSKSLFDRVQERLQAGSSPRTSRAFAYKGLLVCGYCGCQLTAEIKKGKYIYYHCTHSKGRCGQPYYREKELSERLLQAVECIRPSRELVEDLVELVGETTEQRSRERKARLMTLKAEAQRLDDLIDDAYLDKLQCGVSEERWLKVNNRLSEKARAIDEEVERLSSYKEPAVDGIAGTLELLHHAPELYLRQNHEERANLLRDLASNFVITRDSLIPNYRKPFGAVAEGLRSGNWLGEKDSNPH